jgi:hypothetical protein
MYRIEANLPAVTSSKVQKSIISGKYYYKY